MMKPESRKHLLIVSLALLLGVTACSSSMLGPQADPQDQATSPSGGENAVGIDCTDLDPHPIGASIASDYEVSYEQVMTWFCSGYSFDNILIALETSKAVDVPAETLLQMLLEKEWEQIWVEVGLTSGP